MNNNNIISYHINGESEQVLGANPSVMIEEKNKVETTVPDLEIQAAEVSADNTAQEGAEVGGILTAEQQEAREELEQTIRTFGDKSIAAGRALIEIRERELFKGYKSFEAYVRDRLEMGLQNAYRLMRFARTVDIFSPMGEKSPALAPGNERQARALLKLAREEDIRTAWTKARENAGDGKVTGAIVEKVVNAIIKENPETRASKPREKKEKEDDKVGKEDFLPPAERFKKSFEVFIQFAASPEFGKLPPDTRETLKGLLAEAAKAVAEHENQVLLNAA